MKKWLIGLACVGMMAVSAMGAINIAPGTPVTQNFDAIGATATAALPTDWKVDKQATARTVGTYAAAVSATERVDGAAVSSSAGNGIYNMGAPADDSGDRAIGWLSSSSATKSGNLYVQMVNSGGAAITALSIAYDVEKYRNGSNAAGFQIQLYYSTDGSVWTSAGATFLTTFPADADSNGFATPPGATTAVTGTLDLSGTPVANGASIYLAWSYSVQSGTTSSSAQALAVDGISISVPGAAVFGVTFDQTSGFTMEEGTTDAILATAANGTAPYTYAWSSTLGGTHYATNGNEFTILATAPTGSYSATVVATDNTAQRVTNSLNFSVVAAALKYGITVTPAANGTVTTTPADEAAEGVTVTINATPAGGYAVGTVTVVDAGMNPVTVTLPARTFTMPASAVTVAVAFEESSASGELIISQYYEGASNNKWIEIYNPGGTAVDLAAGGYRIGLWANANREAWKTGAAPGSSTALSNSIPAGGTYLIKNSSAVLPAYAVADITSGAMTFTGDDSVVLYTGTTYAYSNVVDAFGMTGTNSMDKSFARKSTINTGVNTDFNAADWDEFSNAAVDAAAEGTNERLGYHSTGAAVFGVALNRANGFTVNQGSSDAITATAANGTAPYGYAWSSTLGGAHYATNAGVFTILATAPTGSYTATVVATDAGAQSATNSVNFAVVAPAPTYAITITPPVNGTVTTTPATNAAAGATVTINATPSGGYAVGTITVVDAGMNPVTVTLPARTFVMPAAAVTVTVAFTESSDTAALPTSFSGPGWYQGTGLPNGWTQTGLGTDYSTSLDDTGASGKFDNSPNDTVQIKYGGAATELTYWLQFNGTWTNSNIFKVQESVDGTNWTDLAVYNDANPISTTKAQFTNAPNAASRYIRFNYANKGSGNVALDGVAISGTSSPTLSYTGSTSILLGNSFALVFTLNGATASGWEYLLESADRADVDTGSTNAFNWTPGSTGTYYLTMTALDGASAPIATREVTLTVTAPNPGDPAVVIAGSLSGTVGQAMNLSITVTNAAATEWYIDLKDPDGLDDYSYNFNTPPAFILTPTKVGTYTLTATAETAGGNYSNAVQLTVAAVAAQPDIPPITFVPASGNFTFTVPAGYALNRVRGADTAVNGQAWVFSNLTLGVHYTVSGTNVTVLTVPQSRKIIQIGVNPAP